MVVLTGSPLKDQSGNFTGAVLVIKDVSRESDLERELKETGGRRYHILVLDAFSDDAIPVHLLTREAFSIYWRHLTLDGILAVHVSNRYLDLTPVVRNLAMAFGKDALRVLTRPGGDTAPGSDWVLITSNERFMDDPEVKRSATQWSDTHPIDVIWTDDYSNLLSLIGKPPAGRVPSRLHD